jgi:hypothetical protein
MTAKKMLHYSNIIGETAFIRKFTGIYTNGQDRKMSEQNKEKAIKI